MPARANLRPRESDARRILVRGIKRAGGVVIKGDRTAGWPDLFVLLPGGELHLIEVKREGERPRPLQLYVHRQLAKLSFAVTLVTGTEEARRWVEQNCGSRDRTKSAD